MNNDSNLLQKLDEFIRTYYLNQLVGGVLLSIAILVGGAFLLFLLEYVGQFGVTGRTIMFWSLIVGGGVVLLRWVMWPTLKLLRLGNRLGYEDASKIIGDHFPEISDRLLNVLQLQNQLSGQLGATSDTTLLQASIEERTRALKPVPFQRAVDWSASKQFLRAATPVVIVASLIALWKPEVIQKPAERIIAHRQDFMPPPPFTFELLNDRLDVPEKESFTIRCTTTGNARPDLVVLEMDDQRYRMEKREAGEFQFTLPLVRNDLEFRFNGGGVLSKTYNLRVLPVPTLLGMEVVATPPAYTGLAPETITDMGNLRIPEGSDVQWRFRSINTDSISLIIAGKTLFASAGAANSFVFNDRPKSSGPYWVVPSNQSVGRLDSLRYTLQITPDQAPRIRVSEVVDSTALKYRYFSGEVDDDYGFSRLVFAYQWLELGERTEDLLVDNRVSREVGEIVRTELTVPKRKSERFFHEWDLNTIGIQQDDVLEYWFEIWDNDRVNGPKMTRSSSYTFAPPSELDLRQERDEANQDITSRMEEARREAEAIREDMEALRRQLAEDDELDWKDERSLEELMKRQSDLQESLQNLQKANEQKDERANEFSAEEERILEKQEQLQELMEQVMSDELRQMYEEMQRLMEEMSPDVLEEIQKQLESMEVDQESLEKELDRALEQFKQLEFEMKMEEAIDDLQQLAEEQRQLSEETQNESSPKDSLKARQDSLNQAFEKIQQELDELEKQNQELTNPNPTMNREEERASIQQKMSDSSNQIEQEKNKKASENQKSAADEMEQMAQQMEAMMQQSEEEAMEEDMDALRALLENIIQLSFEEEDVMAELKTTSDNDPLYIAHGQTQRRLKDDAKMVEDSLFALSLRIPQLAPAVNREIGLINHHMDKALGGFSDRMTPEITTNQQYVMTSFNNLALMLDDALQQMQESMAKKQPGNGNCENPGGNGKPRPSPSAGDMKKMQQALGERLEKMKESMGQGANAGASGKEKRALSKELAQMAAQQAALRQLAEKKGQELNEDGTGNGSQMNDIAKEMEELERDLVNKNVTLETLQRQQALMVRLLEAENAEMQRGEDDKRKSRTGRQDLATDSAPLLEYLQQKNQEIEWLRTVPLELQDYYRDRVNDYFNNLDLKKSNLDQRP